MVGTTFLFTALFVPVVKKMANFIGALDMPNERKKCIRYLFLD